MTRRPWPVLAGMAALAAVVAGGVWLAAAGDDDGEGSPRGEPPLSEERGDGMVPTPIVDAEVVGDDLSVAVGSCNQSPTADVVESDTTVTVTAYAPPPGDDVDSCADGLALRLARPLGDRMVIDGATGMTVAARRPGWVSGGDHVHVVGDHSRPGETSDAAVRFEDSRALAEVWSQTGAAGPAPRFDGEQSDAIVVRVAAPSVCPDRYELLIVDGDELRFQVTGEDGDERPCTSPPQSGHRVVVALVAERSPESLPEGMAEPLEAVSYRDRRIPLLPADAEWPTSPVEPAPSPAPGRPAGS